jgi:2'-hydroxyisoflavone reductase
MKLLLLGGTKFLGRHIVDAALARGHDVTLFTRGRLPHPWGGGVTALVGDRDPAAEGGMRALEEGRWDAVIDTSGYLPRIVSASVALLRERVERYLFVSSISVYADASRPGLDENSPVAELDDPASEDIPKHYGALKAACERVVQSAFGAASLVVRPGLIVGPHDPTDRFGYWMARFGHPALLGGRGLEGLEAVVPETPQRPIQFIDARDLAGWMIRRLETGSGGVFNATSAPGAITMGALVDQLEALSRTTGANVRAKWIDEARIEAAGVEPWTGLPLWIPTFDLSMAGFDQVSTSRADAAGLTHRSLMETLRDTAAWLAARDNTGAWKKVMTAEQESGLLRG